MDEAVSKQAELRQQFIDKVNAYFGVNLADNNTLITDLLQLVKQARVDEVEKYADYLSDQPTQAAFEMGYGEYAYRRTREIDAE